MKKFIILLIALAYPAACYCAFPSDAEIAKLPKSQIIATIKHLQSNAAAADAEAALAVQGVKNVQAKFDALAVERDAAKAEAVKYKTEAHKNAKERDFWIVLGAIGLAAWLGTLVAGPVLRNFPAPESYILAAGVYAALFAAVYTAGRLFTAVVTGFLPF